MKPNQVSLRRRQIMIAGVAGAAAPAALQAAGLDAVAELTAADGQGGLVISGRILARDGRPLTGATVEIAAGGTHAATAATTDGDGRFFAAVPSGRRGRPGLIRYRVSRDGQTLAARELRFARGRQVAEQQAGHLHRDDSGAWRAAFGLALA